MKVLAILQNVWVQNPSRLREVFARPEFKPGTDKRCNFIRHLIFAGCKTGKVLEKYFPDCDEWTYEEATPIIGDSADSSPGWSVRHVCDVIAGQGFDVIVTFGVAARAVVNAIVPPKYVINCPHPCARRSIKKEMEEAAVKLAELKAMRLTNE